MWGHFRKYLLTAALLLSGALGACLPEDRDPSVVGTGKLTGAYYAATLGNVALKVQNAVVGNAEWFTSLTNSMELDLANLSISPTGLAAPLRSHVCPTGSGTEVVQLTWIDGKDEGGKFTLKGVGSDTGAIMGALRKRVAADQVGVYRSGTSIELADGNYLGVPSSCSGIVFPTGAPVIAFRIERPAPPTAEMARTEYRSAPCGVDAAGRERRGTMVESRVVRYLSDGTITPADTSTGWVTENMGQCVDDVVVAFADTTAATDNGDPVLNNFANLVATALKAMLEQQLQMDCKKVEVESDLIKRTDNLGLGVREQKTKAIDTCRSTSITARTAVADTDAVDGSDTRILQCEGSNIASMIRFNNLLGDKLGTSTTTWTDGTATLVRVVDNRDVNNGIGNETQRLKWIGTDIGCYGNETFYVTCNKIPGAPALAARQSYTKWLTQSLNSWFSGRNWFDNIFGTCWFGCTYIVGGHAITLNPAYFTGTDMYQNGGTTTRRNMQATSWLDSSIFKPNPLPSSAWTVSNNQCLWGTRVMIAQCPLIYDPLQQGSWSPATLSPYGGMPVALDPGVGAGGNTTGNMYNSLRAEGRWPATVAVLWRKCNIKGCNDWWESAGPGTGAFIKAWTGSGYNPNDVILTETAKYVRTDLCQDIAMQLDSEAGADQAEATAIAKRDEANAKRAIADSKRLTANQAQDDADQAQADADQATLDAAEARQDATDARALADLTGLPVHEAAADAAEAAADQSEADAAAAQDHADDLQAIADDKDFEADQAETDANVAESQADDAEAAAAAARAMATSGTGSTLTAEQRTFLTDLNTKLCVTQNPTLNTTEQNETKSICSAHYANPTASPLEAIGLYCDAVFDKAAQGDGTYLLTFKQGGPPPGTNVQTTLLNRDGVILAHRPVVENNTSLVVRQTGFVEPLYCGRNEERYFNWPVYRYYVSCSRKGGCWVGGYWSSTTITEATVREWQGYSYETGTWSTAWRVYRSPFGSWSSISQIPNPIYSW